jgi:hypothetical protein
MSSWPRKRTFSAQPAKQRRPFESIPGVSPSPESALVQIRLERSHSIWGRAQAIEVLSIMIPTHKTGSTRRVRSRVEAVADMLLSLPQTRTDRSSRRRARDEVWEG